MAPPAKSYRDWYIAFGSSAFGAALIAFLLSIGAITVTAEPIPTTTVVTTTVAPTTTVKPTTTTPAPTTTAPVSVGVGAPADVGVTPGTALKTWTGPTTITPTTAGVVNGKLDGYLFTGRITVSGNVTITNSRFATENSAVLMIVGSTTPGPVFSHVEVDGLKSKTYTDNIGVVNNGDGHNATPSPFSMDHAWIHGLGNGMRLYTAATVTNTRIDDPFVWGGSHTDGIELYCGTNITLDHLTINMGKWQVGSNGAIETQGSTNGGFCPVSNVVSTNNYFYGGIATYRVADDQFVTNMTVRNVVIEKGVYEYFATTVAVPANIAVWENVRLSDGTPIPRPGTWSECNQYGGSCN